MNAQHTPGPWRVLPPELGKSYLRVRGTRLGGRYKIANVLHPDYENVPDWEAERSTANARLIAAAPELLDACRSALAGEHRAHELLRTAIAKAAGEQS